MDFKFNGLADLDNLSWHAASRRWTNRVAVGGGTVTSVAMTAPAAVFDIAGSPVTGSGTLAVTFDTQNDNLFFAGPTTGGPTAPTFRAIDSSDLPNPTGAGAVFMEASAGGTTDGNLVFDQGTDEFIVRGSVIASNNAASGQIVLDSGNRILYATNSASGNFDITGDGILEGGLRFKTSVDALIPYTASGADTSPSFGLASDPWTNIWSKFSYSGIYANHVVNSGADDAIIDGSTNQFYRVTLGADTNLVVQSLQAGAPVTVIVSNPAAHTVAWNIAVADWIEHDNIAPVQSTNGTDVYTFLWDGQGTNAWHSGRAYSLGVVAPLDLSTNFVTKVVSLTHEDQVANTGFMGPTTGGNAAPAFRALVAADLPSGNVGAVKFTPASGLGYSDEVALQWDDSAKELKLEGALIVSNVYPDTLTLDAVNHRMFMGTTEAALPFFDIAVNGALWGGLRIHTNQYSVEPYHGLGPKFSLGREVNMWSNVFGMNAYFTNIVNRGSLQLFNSAAPTVDADGEIALDTNLYGLHGGLVFDGVHLTMNVVATTNTPSDNQIAVYDATAGAVGWETQAGGGDALVANPLSQFAATTSAQLAGVLSDETGTDKVVYSADPVFTGTPTLDLSGITSAGDLPVAQGGTGASTATAGFDALSPVTTRGDLIYRNATVNARLAVGTSSQLLISDGTDPVWGQADLTADVTGTLPVGNGGSGAATFTDGGVLLGSVAGAFTAMAALADGEIIVGDGTTDPVAESGATARTSLGVAIGVNVQAYDADLDDLADGSLSGSKVGTGIDADNITAGTLAVAQGGTGTNSLAAGNVLFGAGGTVSVTNLATTGAGNVMRTRTGVYREIYVNAGAMIGRTTDGAAAVTTAITTTGDDKMVDTYEFDSGATVEGVGFWIAFPDAWDAGTIKVKAHWTTLAGASGGVTWGVSARSFANDESIDQAASASVDTDDTWIADEDIHITAASAAITVAGATVGEPVYFEVTRETADANDDMAADAGLIGVQIQYLETATEPSAW